jgi:hypothetical protein
MARPPKLAIHDPLYQLKDFFIDESMKRIIPHNPYNVLWIIENAFDNDIKYKNLQKEALIAIKNDGYLEGRNYPVEIKNALIEDKWVIKRMQELHRDYAIDVSSVALKSIRIGSAALVEELLKLGLDPNYKDKEGRTTLSTCINRKRSSLLNIYFEHPKTNRYMLNDQGENVAFTCVRYGNWKFLEKIIDTEPKLLFTLSEKNHSIFDLLGQDTGGKEIFSIIPLSLKEKFEKILDVMHESKFYFSTPQRGQEIIEFIVNKNHSRLLSSLEEKESSKVLLRKI